MKDEEKSIFDDDDEIDTFADAGHDYDELEFMDPDERREVLEDAGLDPDTPPATWDEWQKDAAKTVSYTHLRAHET